LEEPQIGISDADNLGNQAITLSRLPDVCVGEEVFHLDFPMNITFGTLSQDTTAKVRDPFTLCDVSEEIKSEKSTQADMKPSKVVVALRHEVARLRKLLKAEKLKNSTEKCIGPDFEWFTSSPQKFKFYTGLTEEQFEVLYSFLGPDITNLHLWNRTSKTRLKMDTRFQLALTLMHCRQGTTFTDLSYRFGIPMTRISAIFVTFIQFMFIKFGELREKMFAPRFALLPLPKSF
jgi:hypothetical protein